jgi:hypothetical protein
VPTFSPFVAAGLLEWDVRLGRSWRSIVLCAGCLVERGTPQRLTVVGATRGGLASRPPALDELMRKLLVVHRLLEAEERLAKRESGSEPE